MALDLAFWVSIVGTILALMAIFKVTFGYERKHVAIAATVVVIGALIMGGGIFAPILAAVSPAPAGPAVAAGQFSATIATASDDNGQSAAFLIQPSGLSAKEILSAAAMSDAEPTTLTVTVNVLNLNAGQTTDTFSFTASMSTPPSINNATTGATFPMVLPVTNNPGNFQVAFSDSASPAGVQTIAGGVFYASLTAHGTDVVTAVISLNAPSFDAMVAGTDYPLSLTVAGQALQVIYSISA